jgi:hypothetical protein
MQQLTSLIRWLAFVMAIYFLSLTMLHYPEYQRMKEVCRQHWGRDLPPGTVCFCHKSGMFYDAWSRVSGNFILAFIFIIIFAQLHYFHVTSQRLAEQPPERQLETGHLPSTSQSPGTPLSSP